MSIRKSVSFNIIARCTSVIASPSDDADFAPYNDRETNSISRLSWLGKERDNESGLGDHGVRKYSSETGRFISIDPLPRVGLGEVFGIYGLVEREK